jgi:hypothetical protein
MLSDAEGAAGMEVMTKAGLPKPYLFTRDRLRSDENVIFQSMGYTPGWKPPLEA